MQNELLWFLMLIASFIMVMISFRLWGKMGLFIWVPISVILANVQVVKLVDLFGLTATLGNIVYASTFLVTDMLSEHYGKKEAQKAVIFGLVSMLALVILTQFAIWFTPAQDDTSQEHLAAIFGLMPRIVLGSITAYLISQFHDVWAYHFWKDKFPKQLWLRNNASTMVSQLIDSVVFCLIAFLGEFDFKVVLEIILTTYIFKWIVAALDTPFLYISRLLVKQGQIADLKE